MTSRFLGLYSFAWLTVLCNQLQASAITSQQLVEAQSTKQKIEQSELSKTQGQQNKAKWLFEQGRDHYDQGQYVLALDAFTQALNIYREIEDVTGQEYCLYNIAAVHQQQGNYEQAINTYQQTLTISRSLNHPDGEWRILSNLGTIYTDQGQYSQAIAVQEQALNIVRSLEDSTGEQQVLNNLAWVYTDLGQFEQALVSFQKALEVIQQLPAITQGDEQNQQSSASIILYNIGFIYERLNQYSRAIESYRQALLLRQEAEQSSHEAEILSNLGFAYYVIGQREAALSTLDQALKLSEEIGDRDNTIDTLNRLGTVYLGLGEFSEAQSFYQRALSIATEIDSPPQQRSILSNIGDLFAQQNQPQLAILFYKRSVNVTESIRRDIAGLPIDQQQSYTDTVAETYRRLADLLLQQDRILEAQQVLDLLKVQEIQDYLRRGVRGNQQTAQGVEILPAEQQIAAQYDRLIEQAIEAGKELAELDAISPENRTREQQRRVIELRQQEQQIKVAFQDFMRQPGIVAAIRQLEVTIEQEIDPSTINALRQNLQQDDILLYPLVLDDRLELIVLSPHAPPLHYEVPVGRVELNRAISAFLTDLQDHNSDAKPNAQRLYNWLIEPIESVLAQSNTKSIIYAPDGQLRYIPLGALYDGNQWLTERYEVNYITAVSLFNLNRLPQSQPRVLAGAFAEGRYNIPRGGTFLPFSGLPFARPEVETIARLYPNTRQLIDRAFTRAATEPILNDYNIVHLATHAMFTTGSPEDSFILFGDGSTITLRDLSSLSLNNVDLVVLSSCQTAVSTMQLGDGKEILGFGYQIQETGARAAIASLWTVDDGGTEALMRRFYTALRSGNLAKTAALQQAQIALIRGATTTQLEYLAVDADQPVTLEHPYYWASFILIGNGL